MTEQEIQRLAGYASTLTRDRWITFITALNNTQQTALANYVRPIIENKLQADADATAEREIKLLAQKNNLGF